MHWWLLSELIVLFVLIFSVVASISSNPNSVSVLNGTDFKDLEREHANCSWLHGSRPCLKDWETPFSYGFSTSKHRKRHENWDHSNCMSLMIIKRGIFRDTVSDNITSVKELLTEIKKCLAKSDNAETSTLLQSFLN